MRCFGLALVRDDRFVCDDGSAASLVDKLFRQASLTLIDDPTGDVRSARVRAFAQFIRLYRRHVRRMSADEDGGWVEGLASTGRASSSVISGVRNLPLELREALLLVVLAGFSHCQAAEALDIPLAAVIDRLGRARARISAHMGAARESTPREAAWPSAAHLRIVK